RAPDACRPHPTRRRCAAPPSPFRGDPQHASRAPRWEKTFTIITSPDEKRSASHLPLQGGGRRRVAAAGGGGGLQANTSITAITPPRPRALRAADPPLPGEGKGAPSTFSQEGFSRRVTWMIKQRGHST